MGNKTETAEKEEKIEPLVINDQGILLFHLETVTANRAATAINKAIKTDDETTISQAQYSVSTTDGDQLLPCVCLIDTKNPSTFLNLIKGDSEANDSILKMSTFELSSLVPVIRIFKIFKSADLKNEIILEMPFDTSAKGIESIFQNSVGRGEGAGLTSFQWKQNPKNEASTATYKINMNIHLQNVEEFFKSRNSTLTQDGVSLDVSIQDLLYQRKQWREATNQGTAVYNPDDYAIKVIVGWQISDAGLDSIKDNYTGGDIDKFIKALKDQKDVLYLYPVSHTVEFNEDGSLDVNIDFTGRTDINMSDITKSNILTTGRDFEREIDKIKKEIEIKQEKAKATKQINAQSDTSDFTAKLFRFFGDTQDKEQVFDSDIKELKQKLEKLAQSSKKAKYNYLLKSMLEKKQIHTFFYNEKTVDIISKLKGVPNLTDPVESKNFENYLNNINRVHQETTKKGSGAANIQTFDSNIGTNNGLMNGGELLKRNQSIYGANSRLADRVTFEAKTKQDIVENIDNSFETSKTEEFYKILSGDDTQLPSGYYTNQKYLKFFYLSSLIDNLMEPLFDTNKLNSNFLNKSTRVVLGPLTIVDYGSLVESNMIYKIFDKVEAKDTTESEPTYVKIYTGTPRTINIGDLPISLKEFTNWFNDNIVNKNIEQMTLNEFLTSLINDLVLSTLSSQVYIYAPKQKAKFSIDSFTAIPNIENERVFATNIVNYKWTPDNYILGFRGGGFRVPLDLLKPLRTKGSEAELDHNPDNKNYMLAKDYIVIHCINDSPYERVGDYEKDKKEGIMHLRAGESKSIIRSLKFSRVDNPHRRADNILASTTIGKGVSKVIREKYNVTIEMFGNTFLQAGTYFFLSPTYSGQGSVAQTEKILRELGLGGYYLITEVHNSIELGDFKTSLKGTWSAFADGTISDGEQEYSKLAPNVNEEDIRRVIR